MQKSTRKDIIIGLIIIWIIALCIYFILPKMEPALLEKASPLKSHVQLTSTSLDSFGNRIITIITNLSEGTVQRSTLASIGVLLGGFIGHYLWTKKSPNMGYPISMGSGLYPKVVLAIFTGLGFAHFVFGKWEAIGFPTYLPGCTLPAAMVITYGGSLTSILTGAILGSLIQVPLAYLGMQLATKLGLPAVVGSVIFGMALSGYILFTLVKYLPWMKSLVEAKENATEEPLDPELGKAYEKVFAMPDSPSKGILWMFRRSLADFTEIYFFGNEIAGLFLILGFLLSWYLNPSHAGYGIPGFAPTILAGQLMAVSLGIFIHYDKWVERGWYNTFTPAVAIATLILTYGNTLSFVITAGFLSALICPPLAAFFMAKLEKYPGIVGGTLGMAIGIGIISIIVRIINLLIPIM